MYQLIRQLGAAAVIPLAASSIVIAGDHDSRGGRDAYVVTPLVANLAGVPRCKMQYRRIDPASGYELAHMS